MDAAGVPRFIAGLSGWRRLALGVMGEPAARPWRLTGRWIEDPGGAGIVLAGVPAITGSAATRAGGAVYLGERPAWCRVMATSVPCGAPAPRAGEAPDTID